MSLSRKETTFLLLYFQGDSYKLICAKLVISLSTAKTYSRRILARTKSVSLRQAAYKRFVTQPLGPNCEN
jgi:DNA-binding CsgD family transcriptional regulator